MNTLEAISSRMVCNENGREEERAHAQIIRCGERLDGLALVHADAHLLVVDKPAGLLSVPGRGADKQDCAVGAGAAPVPGRAGGPPPGHGHVRPAADGARRGNAAAPEPRVRGSRKWASATSPWSRAACTRPTPADGWALIDLPLAADWPNRPRRIVDRERGKPSQTRWRVLAYDARRGCHAAGTRTRDRDARTSCGCTCRRSAIRSWATRLYAPPEVAGARAAPAAACQRIAAGASGDGATLALSSAAPF